MESKLKFFEAIKGANLSEVRLLLQGDPTLLTEQDDQGVSAILMAVYYGRDEVLGELLAYHLALNIWEASATGQLDRVNELLDQDPTLLDRYSPDGFTPLGLAAFFGRKAVLEELIARGADVNLASNNSMKVHPLHSAVAHQNVSVSLEMAGILLKHGAEANAVQAGGWTPLHEAANRGDLDMVKLLIQNGANKTVRNDDGISPLDMARKNGTESVISILESEYNY